VGKDIQDLLISIIKDSLAELNLDKIFIENLYLDLPSDERFGDLSTNIALRLSKGLKRNPTEIAINLVRVIKKRLEITPEKDYVKEIKVEGAGFINFYLNEKYFYEQLHNLIEKQESFFKRNYGRGRRILVEFVSANPTGPLSIAHARQAAVGDSLSNILNFLGFRAKREYYLNDEGKQIEILGKSVELRLRQLKGENLEFPDNYYQGDYIYEIAKKISATKRGGFAKKFGEKNYSDYAVKHILIIIKKELRDFGVKFDYWTSQKKLRKSGKIERALSFLKKKGFLFEQEGALWFKSTAFGDDKDRVVIKSDGSYTYLAPDIAYHWEKYKHKFSWLINLWGPDHHGYVSRLKAAVKALGYPPDSLTIIIVQLASIFREGRLLEISTRRGQYITLREVLDEVGLDAARFFFLMRRTSSHLDFDLEVAKRKTLENPVYYVQYAYARICSILRNSRIKIKPQDTDLNILKEKEEIDLIKKTLGFVNILNICLNTQDPYMLTVYLQKLAESFHKFYDRHRVLGKDEALTSARLTLIQATKIVIDIGLELLGVSRPQKM
jgi:arginyl-tRNA synthetase